jgi:periplasmic protein TonB
MTVEAGFRREATSADDRMLTTLFLAGLFHLILILGVTFSLPSARDSGATPTLEVLLVSEALPESLRNDDARYLAQRTQQGAGNLSEAGRSRVPTAANAPIDQAGERDGSTVDDDFAGPDGGEAEALAAATTASRISFTADAREPAETLPDRPRQMLAGREATLPSSADDQELRLRGISSRELMVTPSTRQSDVAVYLDAWKRQVERVGTLNFPNEARRRGMSGSPVVEVALAADGRLAEARVRRSSGHAELDQAAIDILRLAAPFEAFPGELAARYDVLRFAYEWQFECGQLTGSTVRAPATQP